MRLSNKQKKEKYKFLCYHYKEREEWNKSFWPFLSEFIFNISENGKPICRYCNEEIEEKDFVSFGTYWGSNLVHCHSWCWQDCQKKEMIACQNIDADCNDCRYFERKGTIRDKEIDWGICLKNKKEVRAYPNFCSGHKCFQNRNEH